MHCVVYREIAVLKICIRVDVDGRTTAVIIKTSTATTARARNQIMRERRGEERRGDAYEMRVRDSDRVMMVVVCGEW